MKIYYAHCLAIYGTTQELRDIRTLTALGFEVVNPSAVAIDERCREIRKAFAARAAGHATLNLAMHAEVEPFASAGEAVMTLVFKPLVEGCDALAFRALPGGAIPAGVSKEIEWANQSSKPVLELPGFATRVVLSVEGTRQYLLEVGQR